MAQRRSQSPLVSRTQEFEDSLREIRCRWYYLTAMHDELTRVSRGKTFRIMNSIAWQMAFDSNHMMVIELSSWLTRQREPGGLFGLLEAHLDELERNFPKRKFNRDLPDGFLSEYDTSGHAEAMNRLFPDASGRIAQSADVAALRARLAAVTQRVVDDRNNNRAHPLERPQGSADWIDLTEAGSVFDKLEQTLNDVRLIADWTTTSFHDMNSTSSEAAAQDFVDAVLIGTSGRHSVVMGGLDRDAFYDRLHDLHDADANQKPDAFFNEYDIEPVEDAVRRMNALREWREQWAASRAPASTGAEQTPVK